MRQVTCIKGKRIYYVNDVDRIAVLVSARTLAVFYMDTKICDNYKISSVMSCASLNGILYVSNVYNQFYIINLTSKEVRKLPRGKIKSNLENFVIQDKYIVCYDLQSIEIFNMETNQWKFLKNRPANVNEFNRRILNYDQTHCLVEICGWEKYDRLVTLDYDTCSFEAKGKCDVADIHYDIDSHMFISVSNGQQSIDILDENLSAVRRIPLKGCSAHITKQSKKKCHYLIEIEISPVEKSEFYIYNIVENKFKKIWTGRGSDPIDLSYQYGLFFQTLYKKETAFTTIFEFNETGYLNE